MIDIDELRTAVEAAGLNAISRDEVLELIDRLEAAEKERDALRARIEQMERQEPCFADAYQGAMEEIAIWKKRALEAEDLNRKFAAEINGPTYMGEPAHPKPDCGEAGHDGGRCGNRQCLPGAQPAPENCPCCGEPMRVYSRCSNSDCEAVTVTPEQARYNKALAFERTVATRMEDQTAPSVTEWVQADTSLPTKYLGMHRADVLKDMISELEERCAILADALRSTAQTLAWVEHGECRGFSDDLLTTNEALDKARAALEKLK